MQVYAVVWSTGSCDDHGNAHSFNGIHGVYKSEVSAQKALEECKQEIYDEALQSFAGDEDNTEDFTDEVKVYGSVKDGYFEIDYTLGNEPVEIYIQITHTYVQD